VIDQLLRQGVVPDIVIRSTIRKLLRQRLREDIEIPLEEAEKRFQKLLCHLKDSPVAVQTKAANEQHYEVPAAFYEHCLGPNMKYSCGLWEKDDDLSSSEARMLQETIANAELRDGMNILELGCGWGSLTLQMARQFPKAKITAVNNSKSQREFILKKAEKESLKNIEVIVCDMNEFYPAEKSFDRVVSVEMFEHMRNYEELLKRIANALTEKGKLFVHIFVHKHTPYLFEVKDESDWMSKYFFSGGTMPSDYLLYHFNKHLFVREHKRYSGQHYAKTAEAWLANMDKKRDILMPLFKEHYKEDAAKFWSYWRIFYMSCAELWNYREGREWFVSHYLLEKHTW
jgi:cyclopropane-fatty-acyl-phospholipid synthase